MKKNKTIKIELSRKQVQEIEDNTKDYIQKFIEIGKVRSLEELGFILDSKTGIPPVNASITYRSANCSVVHYEFLYKKTEYRLYGADDNIETILAVFQKGKELYKQ